MSDKTVSIVNGVLRVNGIERGRIFKDDISGMWVLDPDLRDYLSNCTDTDPLYTLSSWPTRKVAAEWVKEQLANR